MSFELILLFIWHIAKCDIYLYIMVQKSQTKQTNTTIILTSLNLLVNKEYNYVQYESPITSGLKVMVKVKVLVHAEDGDVNIRAMTKVSRTYLS